MKMILFGRISMWKPILNQSCLLFFLLVVRQGSEINKIDELFLSSQKVSLHSDSTSKLSNSIPISSLNLIVNSSDFKVHNSPKAKFRISEGTTETLESEVKNSQKTQILLIVTIIGIILLAVGFMLFLVNRHRKCQLQLRHELEKGEMELQQQTLQVINLNNLIGDIETKLKAIKNDEKLIGKDVQRLLNDMFINRSFGKEWELLDRHFAKLHPNFNQQILKRHNNITLRERRLLALIRLDLSTREISRILSIEQRSVVMSRYRLKQKPGID